MNRTKAQLIEEINKLKTKLRISEDAVITMQENIEASEIEIRKEYDNEIVRLNNQINSMKKVNDDLVLELKNLSKGLMDLNLVIGVTKNQNNTANLAVDALTKNILSNYFSYDDPKPKEEE